VKEFWKSVNVCWIQHKKLASQVFDSQRRTMEGVDWPCRRQSPALWAEHTRRQYSSQCTPDDNWRSTTPPSLATYLQTSTTANTPTVIHRTGVQQRTAIHRTGVYWTTTGVARFHHHWRLTYRCQPQQNTTSTFRWNIINTIQYNKIKSKQDQQALLKAKYCPRVAAALCTQKNPGKTPVTLKFNRVLEVAEVHVRAKLHEAKCSGSCVINSAPDFGQL